MRGSWTLVQRNKSRFQDRLQPRDFSARSAASSSFSSGANILSLSYNSSVPPRVRTAPEIEIKLRVADIPSLVRKLRRIGATPRGRVLERNTLYDTPDSDFRRRGLLLRVRIETPAPSARVSAGPRRAVLTFKAPSQRHAPRIHKRYKERLETELAIQHPAKWPQALKSLGLRPAFRYEKYRSAFRLGTLHLDLDETPAGTFLELEGSPKQIDRAASALGFAPQDYKQATYWDIYAADCRRRGRIPKNMLFRP
jgi:adenylate cyclase, class 2